MKQAIIVETDGTARDIDIESDSLTALQSGVGGYVQAIDISPRLTMWLNEEGKIEGLPHNIVAQVIFDNRFGPGLDKIVGNAVFTGGTDDEGDTLGLDTETADFLKSMSV